jgi:hypothetical protein
LALFDFIKQSYIYFPPPQWMFTSILRGMPTMLNQDKPDRRIFPRIVGNSRESSDISRESQMVALRPDANHIPESHGPASNDASKQVCRAPGR